MSIMKRPRVGPKKDFVSGQSGVETLHCDIMSQLAGFLGPTHLMRFERTRKSMRRLIENSMAWRTVSESEFEIFLGLETREKESDQKSYLVNLQTVHSFRAPFNHRRLHSVPLSDDVAYCNAKICVEKLKLLPPGHGFYIEFAIYNVSDNLSISLVDFDGNGNSSLTFSPDTGAVICETKGPGRRLSGNYACVLPGVPYFGKKHQGLLAIFVSRDGKIMFMRYAHGWDSTGYVSNCDWVQGGVITPCIAFRKPGKYDVTVNCAKVTEEPPHVTSTQHKPESVEWKPLRWIMSEEGSENEDSSSDEDN